MENNNNKNSLGCGKEIHLNAGTGFKCGIANAWGEENLCFECKLKLKNKWNNENIYEQKLRLRDDKFFNDSHFKFNIIRN